MTESTESVVNISNVWKVFGEQADAAIKAIKDEGIGKAEVPPVCRAGRGTSLQAGDSRDRYADVFREDAAICRGVC